MYVFCIYVYIYYHLFEYRYKNQVLKQISTTLYVRTVGVHSPCSAIAPAGARSPAIPPRPHSPRHRARSPLPAPAGSCPAVPSPRPPRAWPHHRALTALRAPQSPPHAQA
jgi:hypothetical protein